MTGAQAEPGEPDDSWPEKLDKWIKKNPGKIIINPPAGNRMRAEPGEEEATGEEPTPPISREKAALNREKALKARAQARRRGLIPGLPRIEPVPEPPENETPPTPQHEAIVRVVDTNIFKKLTEDIENLAASEKLDIDSKKTEGGPEKDALETLHSIEHLLSALVDLQTGKDTKEVPEPNLELPEPPPATPAETQAAPEDQIHKQQAVRPKQVLT
jgi:hypothetical protein